MLRRLVILASAALFLILPAYLRAYSLSGASAAPTVLLGDQLIVNQAAYWVKLPYADVRLLHVSRPKRGDLVLMQRPDNPARAFKRVIGLPGDDRDARQSRSH